MVYEHDINEQQHLSNKLYGCKYQSILVGTGGFALSVVNAIEFNGCQKYTKVGTFDTSAQIHDLIFEQRLEFAIHQFNHFQGWSLVHFTALYVSTGITLSPPQSQGGVYLSGPVIVTEEDSFTDMIRICIDEAFPVCPNTNGPDGMPHCKRKPPTYCRHIQNDSNMPAICRQVANSTSEVG